MAPSALPAVLDGLVTTFSAMSNVTVVDGPLVGTAPDGDYIAVGWTPYDDMGASSVQEWRALRGGGTPPRREDFDVVCYLNSAGGDTDAASVKSRRDGAFTLLGQIETTLRNDLTLAGAVGTDGWVEMKGIDLHQDQSEGGYGTGITFHITGYARI